MEAGARKNRVVDLLGCRHPIVLSPMTMVGDARLAAAVSEAGGFGIFASTLALPGEIDAHLNRIAEATSKPFGVYLMGMQPTLKEVADAVIARKVRAVSYGRGVDRSLIRRFKEAGIVCMTTIGAARHVRKAQELGADVLFVQGSEGGGHTGPTASSVLLPQVLDATALPVVAAGGFFDGRGLAAALAYGAEGIAMGTRFLMSAESPVDRGTLERYLSVGDPAEICVSSAIDGLPQRVIRNRLIEQVERNGASSRLLASLQGAWDWKRRSGATLPQFARQAVAMLRKGPEDALRTVRAASLPQMMHRGLFEADVEDGLLPAGQAAAAIADLPSCADLVAAMVASACQHARDGAQMLGNSCPVKGG